MNVAMLMSLTAKGGELPHLVLGYMGPGSGLAAFGSLLAVAAAVVLVFAGFVWYPLRRAIRAWKRSRAERWPQDR